MFQTQGGFKSQGTKGRVVIFHVLLTLRLNAFVQNKISQPLRTSVTSPWFLN